MSFLKRLWTGIASYRLGYAPQRPYPWRWTTPIVLCGFLLISGLLAAINVPLSAYEVVQEVTYRPNDTLPPLPFSSLIPAILQHPASSFTPQILTVGNTLTPNNSVFNFTIVEAFNELDNSETVSSFSYYNNPLSNNCDVSNMSAEVTISPPTSELSGFGFDSTFNRVVLLLSVGIKCHIPNPFEMTWTSMCDTALTGECSSLPSGNNPAREVFTIIASDLLVPFLGTNFSRPAQDRLVRLQIGVQPCCACNTTSPGGSPTQAPCSLLPTCLTVSQITLESSGGGGYDIMPNTTDIFGNLPDHMGDYFQDIPLQGLTALFQNTFQSLYHLVRMELGVIMENQIYNSPVMFNPTISDVYLPLPSVMGPSLFLTSANDSRSDTANTTLMSEWANTVRFFNDSENVPVINYLRTVPRLKPLGAAITSVFVSTFAMLSALWTVFSLVAGALATFHDHCHSSNHDNFQSASYSISQSEEKTAIMEEWDPGRDSLFMPWKNVNAAQNTFLEALRHDVNTSMAQTQLFLVRIEMLLKKHRLLEEEDNEQGIGLSYHSTATASPQEEDSLLLHRRQSDLYSAV